jgi:zinc/manganese transport system substrate-binding protein
MTGSLIDTFEPAFMQRALVAIVLAATAAGLLSGLVVLRRMAFTTHALGAGTYPGVVAAIGLGVSPTLGGLAASLVLAGALALLIRCRALDVPAATGIALAGALALGSLLESDVVGAGARADALLFGSVLGITDGDLVRGLCAAAAVVVVMAVFWRAFFVTAFDAQFASAAGVRVAAGDLVLIVLLALAVVASVQSVGSLLVSALFVVPGVAARIVARSPAELVGVSLAGALAAAICGLVAAYQLDIPPGAAIAAAACVLPALAFAVRRLRGLRPHRRAAALAAAAMLVIVPAGCGGANAATGFGADTGRVRVVTSNATIADWTREVGGDLVDVRAIVPATADPHDFEPAPSDATAVADADLVLASGLGFDDWMDGLVESAGTSAPRAAVAPAAVANARRGDPHFWHDPRLAARAVERIAALLQEVDATHSARYADRAEAYVARLRALDAEIAARVGRIDPGLRVMVTDHDAFSYFAARYGIEVVGAAIPSTSSAAGASAGDTARLIATIRDRGVAVVFSEATVDPALLERVARETGARLVRGLYADGVGPPGSGAETYLQMMRHNAALIADGLAGDPA